MLTAAEIEEWDGGDTGADTPLSPAMQEFARQLEEATALRMATLAGRRAARCVKEKALRDAGVPFDREEWSR